MKWEIIKDKSEDHWLELKGDDGSRSWYEGEKEEKGVPIYPYHAIVKWDGCVHFNAYSNGKGYGHKCGKDCNCYKDYIHICDIDDMIKTLTELKKVAVKYFQERGYNEDWLMKQSPRSAFEDQGGEEGEK